MKHNHNAQYRNVLIRPIKFKDIEALRVWRNNPKNSVFLSSIPYITSEMQQDWFKRNQLNPNEMTFAIEEIKELNRLVGSFSLYNFSSSSVEFGKILIGDEDAHGKKVGLNCLKAALELCFNQLGFEQVILHVFSDNLAAIKVYSQAGFFVHETHNLDGKKEHTMIIHKL